MSYGSVPWDRKQKRKKLINKHKMRFLERINEKTKMVKIRSEISRENLKMPSVGTANQEHQLR